MLKCFKLKGTCSARKSEKDLTLRLVRLSLPLHLLDSESRFTFRESSAIGAHELLRLLLWGCEQVAEVFFDGRLVGSILRLEVKDAQTHLGELFVVFVVLRLDLSLIDFFFVFFNGLVTHWNRSLCAK